MNYCKLSPEFLFNHDFGMLSDRLWRRLIEFYLIAAYKDDFGRLPDAKELSWFLRQDQQQIQLDLDDLLVGKFLGLEIVKDGPAIYTVMIFDEIRIVVDTDKDEL